MEDSEKNGVVLCFASDATTGTRVLGGYVDPLPGQSGFIGALVTPKQPYLDAKFTPVYYAFSSADSRSCSLTALRAGPPFSWGVTSGGPPGGRSLSKDGTRADSANDFCRLVDGVYYAGNLTDL